MYSMFLAIKILETSKDWLTDWQLTSVCVSACLPSNQSTQLSITLDSQPSNSLLLFSMNKYLFSCTTKFLVLCLATTSTIFHHGTKFWTSLTTLQPTSVQHTVILYSLSQLPKWLYFFELLQFVCKLDRRTVNARGCL